MKRIFVAVALSVATLSAFAGALDPRDPFTDGKRTVDVYTDGASYATGARDPYTDGQSYATEARDPFTDGKNDAVDARDPFTSGK